MAFDQAAGSDLYPSKLLAEYEVKILIFSYSFDTVRFGSTTLTSLGGLDGFVTKWNPANGTLAWALPAGPALTSRLALNGGSIYVVGSFASSTARRPTAAIATCS